MDQAGDITSNSLKAVFHKNFTWYILDPYVAKKRFVFYIGARL